jgi:hypothetical protein
MSVLLNVAQRLITERPEAVEKLITANSDLLTDDELVTLFNEPDLGIHDWCFNAIINRLKASNPISHTVIKLFRNQDPELRKRFFNALGEPPGGRRCSLSSSDRAYYQRQDAQANIALKRLGPALKKQYLEHWKERNEAEAIAETKYIKGLWEDFHGNDEEKAVKAAKAMADSLIARPNDSPFAYNWQEIEGFLEKRGLYGIVRKMTTSAFANK